MGRAILTIILSFACLVFLSNHWLLASSEDQKWDSFITQYRYLIQDEKYELAERMLNNRFSEMESYFEGESPAQKEKLEQLSTAAIDDPKRAEELIYFLKASIQPDPNEFAVGLTMDILNSVEVMERKQVIKQWTTIAPTLNYFLKPTEIQRVNEAMSHYQSSESLETKQFVMQQLELISTESSEQRKYDAFIWTAIIIGTTILCTLVYVGYRKYKAERELNKEKRKLNS
ncbi:sporulation protein YpjB [Halobacillus seohaensis]|uniref:Sporulation protein YpjB n=1 Tax=Halobacillus seohaensis TaxID=447421 RepID=A0ABW2EDP8_9BACI